MNNGPKTLTEFYSKYGWIQNKYGRTKNGEMCGATHPDLAEACLSTALMRITDNARTYDEGYIKWESALMQAIKEQTGMMSGPIGYNVWVGRKFEEVLEVCKRADEIMAKADGR